MSPTVLAFHRRRYDRMLRDLQLEPGSVVPDGTMALRDDATGRRLTPPLHNQTLAEGLTSAIKLAASFLEALDEPAPRSGCANRFGGPHG